MKRAITILTIALVGLSACTRTNLAPEKLEKGRQVQFITAPIKATQTRAASTTDFDRTQTFGSTAYALDASSKWEDNSADAELTDIYNKEISYQNGVWRSKDNTSYYWDNFTGKKLTFLSWYPYTFGGSSTTDLVNSDNLKITDRTVTSGAVSTTYKDFSYTGWKVSAIAGFGYTKDSEKNYIRKTDDGSVDLLLAKSIDCTEKTSSDGVLTEFYHQLCNVKFLATIIDQPESEEEWHVSKVELSGIYTQADLLKTATQTEYIGIWGNHTESSLSSYTYEPETSIELTYTESMTETEIFPQTLMIPQSVFSSGDRTPTITVTYKDKDDVTHTMSGALATNSQTDLITWKAGKSITYHIYISTIDYWIDFSADVNDWEYDETDHTIIIGN